MSELFLSLFGLIFTYGGIMAIKKNLNLKKVGIRTIGTVISTRAVSRTNNSVDDIGPTRWLYRSTVKFTTKDKQIFEVELGDASGREDAIGSKIKIIYDAQIPEEVKENNVLSMVIAPWLFLGCGLFSFLWGILEMFEMINVIK